MPFIQELYHSKGNADDFKEKTSDRLFATFEEVLNMPYSFDYAFDSLITNHPDIGILVSPDNKFRIIHWNISNSDGTFQYFGFIQSKHTDIKKTSAFHKTKTTTVQLYPLIDKSAEIKNPENAITDNKKWYGALYNKIIHTSTKNKDYYTLLGWDGNDKFSQKKIIEVLTFDNNGVPHFGADIFNFQKKYPKRIIFEYSATCNMSLKYSNQKDSIVFGHLAPIEPQLEGQYQYYCSDMSCDGFGFKKGKWNYGADVNAVNDKDEKDKIYHDPRRPIADNESNTIITRKKKKKKEK
ncbi:MAG: hypothetical protein JWP12_286 [Bacteroidetes bacterium]|nr:hypothetical protein [Bacteroidota bacterium]